MESFETDDAVVSYDDEDVAGYLLDTVLTFIKKHECFNGETVQQSDEVLLALPNLMEDIVENHFKFNVEYKES